MTSLILSQAFGNNLGQIGQSFGKFLGANIDNAIIHSLEGTKREESRLSSLKMMTSIDGAPMPKLFGRARISGQIIWASKFKETQIKRRIGGKTGPKVSENIYSISFAIGLCEGEITGIGRVWANGKLFDISQTEFRLYFGNPNQEFDPLIEAELGYGNCPSFNKTAYIVFEDLLLEEFGDRVPQFSFEIFAKASGKDSLSDLIKGVCLIPACGEFAYATTINREIIMAGKEKLINQSQSRQNSDFVSAIENLERELKNAKSISLVSAWFGNDLRAEYCSITPRIEINQKTTLPVAWGVAGLSREDAQKVSQIDGTPAFGGSVNDDSIIEAIEHLKAKHFEITFNPFILMDIPPNNSLSGFDGNFQPPYPWRGRIGFAPSQFGNSNIRAGVNAFYGNARANHFNIAGRIVNYSGPNEWTYSRFILHMASLCKAAGGVDAFLLGSELIGLTRAFDENKTFPFIDKLVELAQEVRAILGANCKISYAADWTEYGALFHDGDTYFPLDKLWADSNIDFIGIDYYAPLSDRRDSQAATQSEIQENIEGGEAYDYYYLDEAARHSQDKTPINDNAYNENWVYRQKDIRGFWSNTHFERINGVRKANSTEWIAKSKPIRLMEFGIPAVDKGANRPSSFPDVKSIENSLPPFSTGARNDYEQANSIRAFLKYWNDNNPTSNIYGGTMIDTSKTHIWAWDARPFPAFPRLQNAWKDGENYEKGHWIMGRTNASELSHLFEWALNRSDINEYDCSKISGLIDGYVFEGSFSARDMLEGLMNAFDIGFKNNNGVATFTNIAGEIFIIENNQIIFKDNSKTETIEIENSGGDVFLSIINGEKDYEITNIKVENEGSQQSEFSLPIIGNHEIGKAVAKNLSAKLNAPTALLEISLPLASSLGFEIGDILKIDNKDFSIQTIDWGKDVTFTLNRRSKKNLQSNLLSSGIDFYQPKVFSKPVFYALDLPYPFTNQNSQMLSLYACQEPFCAAIGIVLDGQIVGEISNCAVLAKNQKTIPASNVSQLLNFEFEIELVFGQDLPQVGHFACIKNGEITDIISYSSRVLIGSQTFKIGKIVRGLNGVAFAPEIIAESDLILIEKGRTDISLPPQYFDIPINLSLISQTINPYKSFEYEAKYSKNFAKPWSPAHISLVRELDEIFINFVPRGIGEFDNWEIEQLIINRVFEIKIRNSQGSVIHTANVLGNLYQYKTEIMDFGAIQEFLDVEIIEIGESGKAGHAIREIKAIKAL